MLASNAFYQDINHEIWGVKSLQMNNVVSNGDIAYLTISNWHVEHPVCSGDGYEEYNVRVSVVRQLESGNYELYPIEQMSTECQYFPGWIFEQGSQSIIVKKNLCCEEWGLDSEIINERSNVNHSANILFEENCLVYPNPIRNSQFYLEAANREIIGVKVFNLNNDLILEERFSPKTRHQVIINNSVQGIFSLIVTYKDNTSENKRIVVF